jgi:nucleoside-diphosphate-sugar epimerase
MLPTAHTAIRPSQTVLLTGATGFLGSHILAMLLREGHRVIALTRNASNTHRVAGLLRQCMAIFNIDAGPLATPFETNHIDLIIHCATQYGRKTTDPRELISANLTLPLSLLHHASRHDVTAFINSDTILDMNINAYALSKKQFREWLTFYSNQIQCCNVALEHFYGPKDDQTKFVARIIHDLITEVDAIELTAGHQKRDFVYIDDVVLAFSHIVDTVLQRPKGLHRFEVGTGHTTTIRDFVTLAAQLTHNRRTQLLFGKLPYRDNEIMESHVDTASLRELGWQPQVSLVDGLRTTIAEERVNLTASDQ